MATSILIVDDVATNRIVLKAKLAAACYDVAQAGDGATALELARKLRPDLILLDLALPDLDGVAVCRRLKADPATRDIPVIMQTALLEHGARLAALRAGAEDFLVKPVDDTLLLARLRSLLRAREDTEPLGPEAAANGGVDGLAEPAAGFAPAACTVEAPAGRIALVAARRATALRWRHALADHLRDDIVVMSREEALGDRGAAPAPDVFVIAADLARPGDGLRLMSELRSAPGTRHAAICIVLPADARERAATALDLGASDLIHEDFEPAEVALRLQGQIARKRRADHLRASVRNGLRLAMIDPLTGLHNRRHALPRLARLADAAAQSGKSYAVMALDLDRFKLVNDTWGHAAGDAVLVEIARRLRQNLRPGDVLARMGGEEFMAALPETGLARARATAERLCRAVENARIHLPGGLGPLTVTMSIGLAIGGAPGEGGEAGAAAVMARADRALLAAKAEGRNQVNAAGCSAA